MLYDLLKPQCRVFLDTRCLKPGDDWDKELRQAQRTCRITAVLVSAFTDHAYYEREEIAVGIEMAREGNEKHRLVPIYLDSSRGIPPYGLTLKQGIFLDEEGSMTDVAETLIALVLQTDELSQYVQPAKDDCPVTLIFKKAFQSFSKATEWMDNDTIKPDFLRLAGQHYTGQLESRYALFRIFGMGKPANLRSIYTRVNVLEKITARQWLSMEELENDYHYRNVSDISEDAEQVSVKALEEFFDRDRRGFGVKRETIDGTEVANRLPKLIVLGKPGAGKTTFLKFLALQCADGLFERKLVPVFVGLKDLSDADIPLRQYLDEQFQICQFPETTPFTEHLLRQGKCILFLDGLDEVSKTREREIINEVVDFAYKYGENQFVVSCRIAAWNYCFEQFTDIEIADFTDEQIRAFISNWFGAGSKKASACWEELERNPPIKELASIPLLLTLLCLAFDDTMSFPQNRAELYKDD